LGGREEAWKELHDQRGVQKPPGFPEKQGGRYACVNKKDGGSLIRELILTEKERGGRQRGNLNSGCWGRGEGLGREESASKWTARRICGEGVSLKPPRGEAGIN